MTLSFSIIFFFAVVAYVLRYGGLEVNRKGVIKFAALWAVLFTFEYYYLLHHSFVWMTDEGDMFPPFYNFYNRFHAGGQYSHALASGSDARAIFLIGDAIVQIDSLLFDVFPVWISILIHKTAVCLIGFSGSYLLLRRGVRAPRFTALALATIYTLIYHRMVNVTFGSGASWALLPSAVYVCVVRSEARNYFRWVIAYSAVAAMVIVPTQGLFPLVSALAGGAVLFRRLNLRFLAGAVIIVAVIFINWIESLYGMLLVSPFSAQGLPGNIHEQSIFAQLAHHVGDAFRKSLTYEIPVFMSLASLLTLAASRNRLLFRATIGLAAPIAAYVAFKLFPWQLLGAATVRNANVGYFLVGLFPLSLCVSAMAIEALPTVFRRWRPSFVVKWGNALLLATGFALLGWYKGHNIEAHWQQGGQAAYDSISNLKERPWAPGEPFRVITLRHKNLAPESNIAFGFYGLHAFDSWINLRIKAHEDYWRLGIHRESPDLGVGIGWHRWDGEFYDLESQASVPLLAAANVRFILSPLPLKGIGLSRVDGPDSRPRDSAMTKIARKRRQQASSGTPLQERIADKIGLVVWRARRLLGFGKLYIYEIAGALPRVFAARSIHVAPDSLSPKEFFRVVERHAPEKAAVVRRTEGANLFAPSPPLRIRGYELTGEGYDIDVDAPAGGTILVNAVVQPFFKAYVDGNPTTIAPANGVHTAVLVPPGGEKVRLIYRRKRFSDVAGNLIKGFE